VRAEDADSAARAVLRLALASAGFERAFLVLRSPVSQRDEAVEMSLSLRADGEMTPSRSVVRQAIRARGPWHRDDAMRDPQLADQHSVRALRIRSAVAVPIGPARSPRGVLLLDSRVGIGAPSRQMQDLLGSFAALIELIARTSPLGAGPPAPRSGRPSGLVGRSPVFRELLAAVENVGPSRLPVLITGPSGSGKEGVARELHAISPRRDAPFLAVNCSAFPEALLESELFGVRRGAFTGADRDRPGLIRLAHGGTLFLDEVGDMPASMQAKLLRVLQDGRVRPVGAGEEHEVDARIISATHRDLRQLVARRTFRQDLFFRLAVVELRVPSLRERLEDLPELASHLVTRLAATSGLPAARVSDSAIEKLVSHAWPGNVRELESVLARALLVARDGVIDACDILVPALQPEDESARHDATLEERMILLALGESRGNVVQAARRIGWSRQKMYRRMRALGLSKRDSVRGVDQDRS
jgi:DNA-binding NtrC family response regulator